MKRSMCGIALLAAATALWSCNGDPTGSIRDSGQEILADPTSLFLSQGESKFVTVELVDGQGNQLAAEFTPQNVGAGVTVVRDSTFLQTTTGTPIQTSERFVVTGVAPGSTSFDVVSGTTTKTVPVRVIPTSFAATFSNATPAANEPVTITLPAGYKFVAGAGASTDQGPAIVQSFTVDSTGLVVLPAPGSTGSMTLDSVQADFLPGITLGGLPTDATITVAAVVPQAGTGATGTAPSLTVPAIDQTISFYDGGTFDYPAPILGGAFGNFPARLYKLVLTTTTSINFVLDWQSAEDLGIYFFTSNGTTEVGSPGDAGGGGAHPETTTFTQPAGTYYVAIVNFNATNPPFFALQMTGAALPPP
jgi:hypothetical protein